MYLSHPGVVRTLPFAVFVAFILVADLVQGVPGLADFDPRYIYPFKVMLVTLLLALLWRRMEELRTLPANRKWLWLWAPFVGLVVFVLWINLDFGWLNLADPDAPGYNPRDPETGELHWPLALTRLAGSALLVPIIEELFWRSFLMRWITQSDFLALAPAAISAKAMLVSSLIFGLEHTLWFAGILAGLAYGWLYRASGSLWPPIVAHGVTNGVLGLWVLGTGNWWYW
ncbi:MAG: CAAX prenyl protease-related protein [Thiobacillus sp.]|nr:CAAX prenyl protease-related protein [Thiobacillus sp.]